MYVIGIDGGGTKTTGVIANARGEVVKEVTVGGTNLNSTERIVVKSELGKLIESLKNDSIIFPKVKRVFAGMSGAGHKDIKNELYDIITSLLPQHVCVTVDNDAITALYSGTLGGPGIVQIAGTGAITFGANRHNQRARVGGWGHLFSDDGSGYALGRDGLRAAFLAYDGLEKSTYINSLLINHFHVKDLPKIIPMIYQAKNPKETIASLSKLVVEAADCDDVIAKEIIRNNGIWLGESLLALYKKLFRDEETCVPVVLAGGLFNRLDLFKEHMEKVMDKNGMNAEIVIPKILPVGGAIIAALKEENLQIDQSISNELFDSIHKNEK